MTGCGDNAGNSDPEGSGGAGGGGTGGESAQTDGNGGNGPGPNESDGEGGTPSQPGNSGGSSNSGGAGPAPGVGGDAAGGTNAGGAGNPIGGAGGDNPGAGGSGGTGLGGGGADSGGTSNGGTAGLGAGGTNAGGTGGLGGCVEGSACTPLDPCHQGALDCSTAEPTCVDTGLPGADGAECGADQVCRGGVCAACVEGQSCTLQDPCASGETSCALGIEECVPSGSAMDIGTQCAGDFTPADATDDGFCSAAGVCECPEGTAYSQGQCAPCPEGTFDAWLYVNADPEVGADNHCCGRTETAGFGGPCRTVTGALAASGATGASINITPTLTGDLSPAEQYPLRLSGGTHLNSYLNQERVCIPGAADVPVIQIEDGASNLNYLHIGSNCQGVASGASVGIEIGPGSANSEPRAVIYNTNVDGPDIGVKILPYGVLENVYTPGIGAAAVYIRNTKDVGIQIDGGTLFGFFDVENPGAIGVLCRSDSDPALPSNLGLPTGDQSGFSVRGATDYSVLASMNCRTPRPISIGLVGFGCSTLAPTYDRYGLYAEGDAQVIVSNATVGCFTENGVSLRNNPELAVNAPQVEVQSGTLYNTQCAAAYAEVGSLRIYDTIFNGNHWGAIQRSAASSTDPASALLNLSGQTETSTLPNQFFCNGQSLVPSSCEGPGGDVWNNSGLVLVASNNEWPAFPLSQCNCDEALTDCTCVGAAFGETAPPAGLSVLMSPFEGSDPGSSDVSEAAAGAAMECTP